MAKVVANVNGVDVYSDKQVSAIVNTRISFSDGSWCDVVTGEIENSGPGYISIGTMPSGKSGKKETETKNFSGISLSARELSSTDLDIQPHDGIDIIVSKEGSKSDIEKIRVYENDKAVIIEGEGIQNGGASIRIGGIKMSSVRGISQLITGSNVVMRAGNISISSGGKGKENDTKVKVKVPKGLSVHIANIDGLTTIGDIDGRLRISSNTGGDVHVGSAGDTDIKIQGSTDIRIKHVRENLSASIQGSGDVKVNQGEVNSLFVNIQGSGDFRYGGKAVNADLSVMGSGDIDVSYVENRPVTNCMGSGDIEIGNW